MVKRRKKVKAKKRSKPVIRRKRKSKQVATLPKTFIIEKEIEGITRLLVEVGAAHPAEFFDPPYGADQVVQFPFKKEAEDYLAAAYPGDFTAKVVPLGKHYTLGFAVSLQDMSIASGISRIASSPKALSFKELVRVTRADLKARTKLSQTEAKIALKRIKDIKKLTANFNKAIAKYGA